METVEVFVMSSEPWYADRDYKIEDPMAVDLAIQSDPSELHIAATPITINITP
ncbi:MAG: hypothetical protein JKY86_00670 [Gammaproteobacteria bacterium]|nr:hypothetical protein [Gammaproteobacteria bacterium]